MNRTEAKTADGLIIYGDFWNFWRGFYFVHTPCRDFGFILITLWGAFNVTAAFMFIGVSCFIFLSHGRDSHKIASKNKPAVELDPRDY